MPVYLNEADRKLHPVTIKEGFKKETFQLPDGYSRMASLLGDGSYGTVIRTTTQFDSNARHKVVEVAIKRLHNPMGTKRYAQVCYREIMLLKHLNHPNIVRIIDMYAVGDNAEQLSEIYLVMDYAGSTLDKLLDESRKADRPLVKMEKIPSVIYDILSALQYLEAKDVLHRDLKPSNIALNDSKTVHIDFGMARTRDDHSQLTNQAGTKCYSAPEMRIFKDGLYGREVDMWSVGCILAELLIWRVLFEQEGKEMIRRYVSLFGPFSDAILDMVESHVPTLRKSFVKIQTSITEWTAPNDFFAERNKVASPLEAESFISSVDLICKCLQFDKSSRITIGSALDHPFVRQAHNGRLPDCSGVQRLVYNDSQRSLCDWRKTVFHEIMYHPAGADTPRP